MEAAVSWVCLWEIPSVVGEKRRQVREVKSWLLKSSNGVDDMFCRKHNAGCVVGLLRVILVGGTGELMEWLVR